MRGIECAHNNLMGSKKERDGAEAIHDNALHRGREVLVVGGFVQMKSQLDLNLCATEASISQNTGVSFCRNMLV